MRGVVQRVKSASVTVDGALISEINEGLLVLVGVEKGDNESDIDYMTSKIAGLRVFEDDDGKMNLSVNEVGGEVLLVSQFTLAGDARKGRRPSFGKAESAERASELIEKLAKGIAGEGVNVKSGIFQAHMEVGLINDGPVTILLDSRKLF